MAYEALKSLIRQYIKPNEQEEITGAILQGILLEMVNQLGVAGNYLPLTGGNITGNVIVSSDPTATTHNAVRLTQSGVTIENIASVGLNEVLALSANSIIYQSYFPNATPSTMAVSFGMTGITLTGGITASSFVNSSVEQSVRGNYLLKADGNVVSISDIGGGVDMSVVWESLADDTNEQIASSHLTNALSTYATQSWVTTQLADYLPLDGGTMTGDINMNNYNFMLGVDAYIHADNISGYDYMRFFGANAYTFDNYIDAPAFKKSGGTSSQFLKADGSVDSNTYLTSAALAGYLPLTGGTLTGNLTVDGNVGIGGTPSAYKLDVNGQVWATGFIKESGTSSQFLKADGSVDSNTYLTSASLADYLPLTGGTLRGNLTVLNSYLSVVAASSSSTPYTTTITSSAVELRMKMTSTSIDYLAMLTPDGLTLYDHNDAGTTITLSSVTSGSFIKSGGTSDQFLKADGSVDSNAYITLASVKGNLSVWNNTAMTWGTLTAANGYTIGVHASSSDGGDWGMCYKSGQISMQLDGWYYQNEGRYRVVDTSDLASYNPTSNFKTINNQSIVGTGNINIEGGGGTLYDAEIEYLQSSGTQWIDTDVVPSSGLVTEIDFQYVSLNNDTSLFGAWDNIGYHCTLYSSRWYYCSFSGESNVAWRSGSPNTNRHKIKIDGHGGIYEDDVKIATTSESSGTMSSSIVIFARKRGSTIQCKSVIKCYGLKMYSSNGTLVRDFIPVRVGNVGYLYDKVSGELFGNAGTGDFVLGQDTGPGGGLPYLPLTGGTISGNLTINSGRDNTYLEIYGESSNGSGRIWIDGDGFNFWCRGGSNQLYFSNNSYFQGNIETDSRMGIGTGYSNTYQLIVNGQVGATGFVNTSDLRKKTITGDVPMNLYNVANAPLFKFTWKDEKEYSGQHIGSAAQYWQTVLPELVIQGSDADMTLAMQYDVIALASAITVAKTVVNHEERIILLERENEALKKEIADLKSA